MTSLTAYYTLIIASNERELADRRQAAATARPSPADRLRAFLVALRPGRPAARPA